MAESKKPQAPREPSIKVQRKRRRIYQQPETGAAASPAAKPSRRSRPPAQAAQPAPAPPASIEPGEEPRSQAAPASPGGEGLEPQGRGIIRRYMALATGAGLIPAPIIDTLALGTLQLMLIRDLARLHGAEFSLARGRNLLAALLGSVGTVSVATGYLASLVKALPLVGYGAGAATMPALAGAATFAVGRVFERHFAAGGSLWDFDPERKAAELKQELNEGRRRARAAGARP